ncbi:substrate-binding domain-containing protein [Brachybacterium sp. AOP29-B2-41]|uniref:substrate-binding domain-containing protein n=1 Tax=Brachybacterium sp. AOP29-B2-41 TaxID=3457704 RepID=UPI0040343617
MTRIRVPFLFAAAAALVLSGCSSVIDTGTGDSGEAGGGDAASTLPAACEEENPYVAVSLPNLTNPYYVAMKNGFEKGGEANGFDVEVQIAGDDDAQQLSQVQAMLQKQPCALALNPVKSEPAAGIVKAANDAGVPVFTVNVIVDEEALEAQGASIIQYLGADNQAGGQAMGEQVLADMGAEEPMEIAFITEPDERPVVIRDEGFTEAIEANPQAEIVAQVDGNVKPDDSLAATGEVLQGNPDVNVVWASTGPATYGALQAIGDRDDVKVYGFCASEEPLEGAYAGCVAQEPELYGTNVTEQIRAYVEGEDVEEEILMPLKKFGPGETPAPGEVG